MFVGHEIWYQMGQITNVKRYQMFMRVQDVLGCAVLHWHSSCKIAILRNASRVVRFRPTTGEVVL